jgi:hypothetical protein
MGLSLTLFGLASLPLAFERTCALPAPVPAQLVQAGLGLLAAANDAARKNAALFFDSAVHYPVLLDCFDECDGLHRLLYPLRHVVQLLQVGGPAELRAERQVSGAVLVQCWYCFANDFYVFSLPFLCLSTHLSIYASSIMPLSMFRRTLVTCMHVCCNHRPALGQLHHACWYHYFHDIVSAYCGVQVAYHASRALLQYIRAQLVIHLTALQRRLRDGPVSSSQAHRLCCCCCYSIITRTPVHLPWWRWQSQQLLQRQ